MADSGFIFSVDGKRYELNFEELTGRDAKEFRAQTGIAIRKAVSMFVTDPDNVDLDTIAGVIWLSRRQAGETVEYDTVLGEVTYATTIVPESGDVTPPEV